MAGSTSCVAGKTAKGSLEGKVDLELDDIAFRPLSKVDAERVSDTVGMPLETLVGLLQDNEGRITLTLPVSGSLAYPDVDISDAATKPLAVR